MPYKNKQNKKNPWMGQVKLNGKKFRQSFKTKKEAAEWEAKQRSGIVSLTSTTSLHEWAVRYLDYAKRKYVLKTYQEKRIAFKLFLGNRNVNPESSVSDLELLVVLDHLQEQEELRSGNAANKDRKNLRAAWVWGIKYLDMPQLNPFALIEKFGEQRHERPVPNLDEFWKVYDCAETDQDKIMLFAYLQTGARREELFRLRWKDVDFFNKKIRLYWRKNKQGSWKASWLAMGDELSAELKRHHQVTGGKRFVFFNMQGSDNPKYWVPYQYRQHWLKDLCEKAGVKQFGFHGIRHLCASILAAQNVPLVDIQHQLRHEHLSTTERYIHRLRDNRDAVKALPGLRRGLNVGPKKGPQEIKTGTQQVC